MAKTTETREYALNLNELGVVQKRSCGRNYFEIAKADFEPYKGDGKVRLIIHFGKPRYLNADGGNQKTIVFYVIEADKKMPFEMAVLTRGKGHIRGKGRQMDGWKKLNKKPIEAGNLLVNVYATIGE